MAIHFEMIKRLSIKVTHMAVRKRSPVVIAPMGAIFARLVEIRLFALPCFFIIYREEMGTYAGGRV